MAIPPDPSSFRSGGTVAYWLACGVLFALVPGAGWLGWHLGGWVGLLIGIPCGAVVAIGVWFIVAFMYGMSQDGA